MWAARPCPSAGPLLCYLTWVQTEPHSEPLIKGRKFGGGSTKQEFVMDKVEAVSASYADGK